jgi:hypothetical protein
LTGRGAASEADVLHDPDTLLSTLEEVRRAIQACEHLVRRAGEALRDELEAGSLVDMSAVRPRTTATAGPEEYLDVARRLGETATQLDQLVTTAAALRREASVGYSTSMDGQTLVGQWVVEAALLYEGPGR